MKKIITNIIIRNIIYIAFIASALSLSCKDHGPIYYAIHDDRASAIPGEVEVLSTDPADGDTDVPVDTAVSATFNILMDPATVTAQAADGTCTDSFQLSIDNFASCTGGAVTSQDDIEFVFTPATDLEYSTTYKIKIINTVSGAAGEILAETFTQASGFATEGTSLPHVISTVPADGDTNQSLNPPISINFNHTMNPATLTLNTADTSCSGSIQVSSDSFSTCVRMTSQPTASSGDATFTVNPSSNLAFNTLYQIRVTIAAEDAYGNNLQAEFTSPTGFRTVPRPPDITSLGITPCYNTLKLEWTNPVMTNFGGVRVQRSTAGYPSSPTDGTNAYNSTGTSFTDSTLPLTAHYYTAFVYDTANNYSTGVQISATPNSHKWFPNFAEYASNPIITHPNSSYEQYYASVIYNAGSFGNNIGDDIDGTGTDTYSIRPYYKMWIGNNDGSTPQPPGPNYNMDFLYSDDGINWVRPSVGANICANHYHPTVIYNMGGITGYRMWSPPTNWATIDYYTSTNGVTWTSDVSGQLSQTANVEPDLPYSAIYEITSITYEGTDYYAWINTNGHWNMVSSTDAKSWNNLGECTLDILTIPPDPANYYFSTDGRAFIIHRNGIYEMWYSSNESGIFKPDGDRRKGISYAESSTNGRTYKVVDNIAYKGTGISPAGPQANAILKITGAPAWRTSITYTPCLIYDSNKFSGHGEARHYKMYYIGRPGGGKRAIGYLSFDENCE